MFIFIKKYDYEVVDLLDGKQSIKPSGHFAEQKVNCRCAGGVWDSSADEGAALPSLAVSNLAPSRQINLLEAPPGSAGAAEDQLQPPI
jgi:hypothetical protein